MSDQRLRDLERQATQSGSPDDLAALLLAQVRAGVRTLESLELPAYCGHEAALRLVSDEPRAWGAANEPKGECSECGWYLIHRLRCSRVTLSGWVQGLSHWGPACLIRAAIFSARVILPPWEDEQIDEGVTMVVNGSDTDLKLSKMLNEEGRLKQLTKRNAMAPRVALAAAEAWLADPTVKNAREAERLGPGRCGPRMRWVTSIGQAIAAYQQGRGDMSIKNDLTRVGHEFAQEAIMDAVEVMEDVRRLPGGQILAAVRAGLIEHALGAL